MPLWTPSRLSALAFWLKADAITGLSDTDPVATWPDSSGNAVDFTQATGAKRLQYRTNIQNGLPIVRGDGTQKWMQSPTYTGLNGLSGTTFFYLVKVSNTAGQNDLLTSSESAIVVSSQMEMGIWYETPASSGSNFAYHNYSSTAYVLRTVLFNGTLSGNSNRLQVFSDGTAITETFSGTIGATTGSPAGSVLYLSRRHGAESRYWNGDLAEIIAVPAALSTDDRQRTEGYLAHRWGVQANLPVDHPWYGSAPTYGDSRRRRSLIRGGVL